MKDMSTTPAYEQIYDNEPPFSSEDMEKFMENQDNFLIYAIFHLAKVEIHNNAILTAPTFDVNTVVEDPDMSFELYNQVQSRLRHQAEVSQDALDKRSEIRRLILYLKLIASLIPLFTAIKKSGKVINLNRLLQVTNFGSSDELRTEKELPPHILGKNFKCKHFDFKDHYFGLNGRMVFDPETEKVESGENKLSSHYDDLIGKARENLDNLLDNSNVYAESYPVPVHTLDGEKSVNLILLDTEPFSTVQGQMKPTWVQVVLDEEAKLQDKNATIRDEEVKEFFKRKYGFKKAMNLMIPFNGVRVAAELGLITAFQLFIEKGSTVLLAKEDEKGLSLLHLAAIKNQVSILTYLLGKGVDIDVRRYQHFQKQFGQTAMHFACKHGSSDVVDCLLAAKAKINIRDSNGWYAVHCAAYYDHQLILAKILARDETQIDLNTQNKNKESPLHLAASSGALKTTKILLENGAQYVKTTVKGENVIHLAALNGHNNVIKFYIEQKYEDLPVWDILVAMLNETDVQKIASALKALEFLSTADEHYWKFMLKANAVPALVEQMHSKNMDIVALACSIVNNISKHRETRIALSRANSVPILIELLGSSEADIQSRSAIIQTDLADLSIDVSNDMREKGVIEKMFEVLDEGTVEDVLINVMTLTVPLCKENPDNQTALMDFRIDMIHLDLLASNSDDLRAAAARSVAATVRNHVQNQCSLVYAGVLPPLIDLMKVRNLQVQIAGAGALEALATNNPDTQAIILAHEAHVPLIKLLKVWSLQVKEQAAFALWALAGQALMQQKTVADAITIPQIIDMILLPSDKLKYVGCLCMDSYSRNDVTIQNKLVQQSAVAPLVRLLRTPKLIRDVKLACIKAIGTLCVGVANRNNFITQTKLAEESAIPLVLNCLLDKQKDTYLRVEAAYALSKLVLNNSHNLELLKSNKYFNYIDILAFLNDDDISVARIAGLTIATFAFNNLKQQFAIKKAGGVTLNQFKIFLDHEDETYQATGAFLVTVLAKLIVDRDEISLTSKSVNRLSELLKSRNDQAVIKAAGYIASLSHTRAGIPQVFVTLGVVEQCVKNLQTSSNIEVKRASSNALGYLTFNALAARILFATCRARPMLFHELMENIEADAKIADNFVENFNMEMSTGCPMHHLEVMGGPPIKTKSNYSETASTRPSTRSSAFTKSRPTTSGTQRTSLTTGYRSKDQRSLRSIPVTSTPTPGRPMLRPITAHITSSAKKDSVMLPKSVKIADH